MNSDQTNLLKAVRLKPTGVENVLIEESFLNELISQGYLEKKYFIEITEKGQSYLNRLEVPEVIKETALYPKNSNLKELHSNKDFRVEDNPESIHVVKNGKRVGIYVLKLLNQKYPILISKSKEDVEDITKFNLI